jgi:hypothetical protein
LAFLFPPFIRGCNALPLLKTVHSFPDQSFQLLLRSHLQLFWCAKVFILIDKIGGSERSS